MSVIAKFRCNSVEQLPPNTSKGYETSANSKVRLGAVYEQEDAARDENNPNRKENAIFGKATPHGEIVMGIMNKPAAEFFEPGAEYYVTFTKVPKPADPA